MRRALLALALLAACGEGEDPGPDPGARGSVRRDARTVVLVVVDGLRRDHLASYGYDLDPTPELTELAAQSAVFEDTIAVTTGANAGLASLLTGQHPVDHGVGSLRHRGQHRLADARTSLAEVLRDAGWRTFAAVSLPQLGAGISGLDQGFEVWHAPGLHEGERRDAEATWYNALPELRAVLEGDAPAFVLLHLADPGARTGAPGGDGVRFLETHLGRFRDERPLVAGALGRAAGDPEGALEDLQRQLGRGRGSPIHGAWRAAGYDSRLAVVDRVIGELRGLLARTGRAEGALLVVTATRGAVLTPPPGASAPGFAPALYEVPLVVRFPGGAPRGRVPGVASALDLGPTLAQALGVVLPDAGGADLLARLESQDAAPLGAAPLISPGFETAAAVTADLLIEEHRVGGVIFWHRDGTRAFEKNLTPEEQAQVPAWSRVQGPGRSRGETHLTLESTGDWPLRVNWVLTAGFVGATRLEQGPAVRTIAPRGLSAVVQFDPGPGSVRTVLGEREAALRLGIDFGDATPGDERILIGARPLRLSLVPRPPDPGAPAWPRSEDGGYLPASAVLENRGSGWWRLAVGGDLEAGRAVDCLVTLFPPASVEEPMGWDGGPEVDVQSVAGRTDALRVRGVTPLEISIERQSPLQDLALGVLVDGEALSGDRIRHGDRALEDPGEIDLYLPDWIEGVTGDLTAVPEADLPPGHLRITRTGPLLVPAERAPASAEEREFARQLGGRE